MEPSDKDLMLMVSAGDLQRFGTLFERYHQKLFEYFYRLSGDSASSYDLVQEVFLRMLKYRETFRPQSEFRAWMYQIARTARIDRFRNEKRSSGIHEERSQHYGPDRVVEQEERLDLLHRALLELPEDKREILILARFQEMKYEQIATLLDIEVGAVKVRVHRAIVDLRELYVRISGGKPKCDVSKSRKTLRTT
jgi:RNA polymerase sigma factor (sigma-70 family)